MSDNNDLTLFEGPLYAQLICKYIPGLYKSIKQQMIKLHERRSSIKEIYDINLSLTFTNRTNDYMLH